MPDFSKYEPRLIEYLRAKGIDVPPEGGLSQCINPDHEGRNPSCQVTKDSFYCHSCEMRGDIYDAVYLLEGIRMGDWFETTMALYGFVENFFREAANA